MAVRLQKHCGMARQLRVHAPGVAAHVVSRGNNKTPIFLDDGDYAHYEGVLSEGLNRFGVTCHSYCFLWNHLHLVLTPWEHPLSRLMQQVNSTYCEWFNKRHGRVGHVLQGRYRCRLIDDESYFLNAIRYVALNPVTANKVRRPEDWPWSSYRVMMGLAETPAFLDFTAIFRALDADTENEMRERLRVFVEAGDVSDGWRSLIEGTTRFMRAMDPMLEPHRGNPEFTYGDRYATRPSLSELLHDRAGLALDMAVAEAFLKHAYTLREIGEALGGRHASTIWRWIQRTLHARAE